MAIGGIDEKDAISKLNHNLRHLVVLLNEQIGSYQLFACKDREGAESIETSLNMACLYQVILQKSFDMD